MSAKSSSVHIMGADGEVKHFSLYQFPRAGLKSMKGVASFDGMLLIRSPKDRLYVHGGFAQRFGFCHIGWAWGWLPRLAECLYQLGYISEADKQATITKHSNEIAEREHRYAVDSFIRSAETLGVKSQAEKILAKAVKP